ncbi:hypothetical protein ABWL39_08835 [Chitinivorax sp. PXF-14]|uniref:hypothetical protein n=1 Tax=Chitinivorax sp. PXF-14 TaxID=3230488 RepID=UPI003466E7D7
MLAKPGKSPWSTLPSRIERRLFSTSHTLIAPRDPRRGRLWQSLLATVQSSWPMLLAMAWLAAAMAGSD